MRYDETSLIWFVTPASSDSTEDLYAEWFYAYYFTPDYIPE